jgi:hypothetical protein
MSFDEDSQDPISRRRAELLEMMDSMMRPRLLVNKYMPRVAAIIEERGIWQHTLVGRALVSVSIISPSLNPIWMVVPGNVNVICGHTPSE